MNQKEGLLLINAKSRQGEAMGEKIRAAVEAAGIKTIHAACEPEDFSETIEKHADRISFVMVAGGDGSQNAALRGLMKTQIPLVVIPLGTSNNLARNLELPLDPLEALKLASTGVVREIDLGSINDLPFFNVAGMGISIRVNESVPSKLKRFFGMFAYILTALKIFVKYRPFHAQIETSEGPLKNVRSLQISVCNGMHFGSGLKVHEKATLKDGKLHLFSVEVKHWYDVFRAISGLRTGKHEDDGPALILESGDFTIRTRKVKRIDVDGEIRTQRRPIFPYFREP